MKIVHVEDFFHPDAGYQLNILAKNMARLGHEVTIICATMDKVPEHLVAFFGREDIEERDRYYSQKYGVKIVRLPLIAFVSGRAVFHHDMFRTIRNENPDVVYMHGNDTLTAMRYLLNINKMRYPLVMDSHMLEMASVNRFSLAFRKVYKKLFASIIIKNNVPVIRTQDDPYVEKCLGIPLVQAPLISFGSDTMLFHPDDSVRKKFRAENGIASESFVILYAGKLDESKGAHLLADALLEKISADQEIVFVIVGNTSGEYGEKIEQKLQNSQNRILRFETQKYENLAYFYQSADLALFPKQCSLSFFDVQACGVPVVFEDNNINIDRAAHGSACVFKAGNVSDFRDKIIEMCNMDNQDYNSIRRKSVEYIRKNYDYTYIIEKYMEVLEETVRNYAV